MNLTVSLWELTILLTFESAASVDLALPPTLRSFHSDLLTKIARYVLIDMPSHPSCDREMVHHRELPAHFLGGGGGGGEKEKEEGGK